MYSFSRSINPYKTDLTQTFAKSYTYYDILGDELRHKHHRLHGPDDNIVSSIA